MYFQQLPIGGFDSNFSYIIGDEATKEVFLVDPDNRPMIEQALKQQQLIPKAIILTHGHFDHIGVSPELATEFNLPIYLHFADLPIVQKQLPNLQDLAKSDILQVGNLIIKIIHTPGHAAGAVCLHAETKLITGDTVFVGRCGRVDLPGSDPQKLHESIQKLKQFPDNTEIWPGHDYGATPFSTIAREKTSNPHFL